MAWIVGVKCEAVNIVNTEWIKEVEVQEYISTGGERGVMAIMFFGDGQTTEVFNAETTASVSTVTELLLNALKADKSLIVIFDELIKRAELLESKEV